MQRPLASPTVLFDLIQGSQVRSTAEGQVIVRTVKLVNIPVFVGMSDPTVLTRCIPYLPAAFSNHPDTTNFPYATLREQNVRSVPAANQAIIELVYRAPGPSDFITEDVTQTEFLETFATAGGQNALKVWYKKGEPSTTTSKPSGADEVAGSTQKLVPKRVMRIKGWQTKTQWNAAKTNWRAAIGTINNTQWGTDVTDDRGTWLFAGMSALTNDFNRTFWLEFYFMKAIHTWYQVRAYLDIHGEHPPDSATESQLRSLGPPSVGGSVTLNGIAAYSIYDEIDFNAVFPFSPI